MLQMLLERLETYGDYLTTNEVAELLDVTRMTVSRWIKQGYLPGSYKEGLGRQNAWRIPKATVIAYIKKVYPAE